MARKSKAKTKASQAELHQEKGKGPSYDFQAKNLKFMDAILGVSLLEVKEDVEVEIQEEIFLQDIQ